MHHDLVVPFLDIRPTPRRSAPIPSAPTRRRWTIFRFCSLSKTGTRWSRRTSSVRDPEHDSIDIWKRSMGGIERRDVPTEHPSVTSRSTVDLAGSMGTGQIRVPPIPQKYKGSIIMSCKKWPRCGRPIT
jgi:hypothetical protein